jgi:FixJ family two-component response regulator
MRQPVVCVVDGDPAVRDSLQYLCDSSGHMAKGFSTQAAFLRMLDDVQEIFPKCVICEAQLPDGSGVDLYQTLKQRGVEIPFALLISRSSVITAPSARRAGIEYVWPKPLVDRTPLIAFLSG